MPQAGSHLLHELLAKKREQEIALDPNAELLTYAERKRRQGTKYRKHEWLRTTAKSKDSRGKAQNLWHTNPPKSKRNSKTSAERASSYASSRKRDDLLAERRAESVLRNRAKNRSQQEQFEDEEEDELEGNQQSLIPDIMVSWTLPDPLPDTMDTWRGKRRKQARQGSERRAFIVLCSEIRRRLGTSGVHLFDEHPNNVQYDVADIAEAVWTIEPRVRRACAKRSDAICDTFFSLEKIVEEKKSQENALKLMEHELQELDSQRREALEVAKEKVEQPSIRVLKQTIGFDAWPSYQRTLDSALRKVRALVIRTPGTLDKIAEKLQHSRSRQEEGSAPPLKGLTSDAFGSFLRAIATDVGAMEYRVSEEEVEQLTIHFQTHSDQSVNTEEFMRMVRSSHPIRQAAVNEAYTWLKALIEHAYERLRERNEVANSSVPSAASKAQKGARGGDGGNDELCAQVRFMYKRHLVSQSSGARRNENSVLQDIEKHKHLLDDWLQTLPPPDADLDIPRIVPHASWSLYYAVLGDSMDDDGQFLSMMAHAWGVRAGRRYAAQWDALKRKLHAYEQLEVGLGSAQRKFAERLEALRALPEMCLSGQSVSWLTREMRELQQLQMLWLDHNAIRAVPEHLAELGNLSFLQLDGNMVEKLPPELAQLGNLRKLFLRHNRMHSPKFSFPMQLQDLQDLQELQLGHNRLSSLPPCFAKLPRLRVLGMEHNHLHGVPGEILGQMRGLQHLALNNNDLTMLPAEVGQLHKLRTLHLHENALRRLPRTFDRLSQLQVLSLHANCLRMARYGEKGSAVWPKLAPSLTSVTLHGNELEELPRSLECFSNLSVLSLQDNMFVDVPAGLHQLRHCSELNLASNQLQMPFELRDMLAGKLGASAQSRAAEAGGGSRGHGHVRPPDANLLQYADVLEAHYATRGGIGEMFAATVTAAVLGAIGVQPEHQKLLLELIQAYKAFVPAPSFLTPAHPDPTSGPFVSSIDRIEVLHLNDNQLGWLPRGLGLLSSTLRVLFLQDNQLSALPGDLGALVHLRVLNGARNKLTALPLSLLKLPRLAEVHLVGNPFPPPLDQVVATSSYVSPLEVDFDRAMRKLTAAMALLLKEVAVDPSRNMSSFSPMPGRAALEMLFRRIDQSRTGIVSERELRDCLAGRRFDFRGVTVTPAEVEAVVEMVFYHGLGRERLDAAEGVDALEGGNGNGAEGGESAAAAAAAAHLANASAGNIRLHELEFVQIVESAMQRGTTSTMAQAVRKFLLVRRSQTAMARHNVFSTAATIQARVRGFLQRRQPRLPGFSFAPPTARAELGERRERAAHTKRAADREETQRQREGQQQRRAVEKLQRELGMAQAEVRAAKERKMRADKDAAARISRKREKVREMKKSIAQVGRHVELHAQRQEVTARLGAQARAVSVTRAEMHFDRKGKGKGKGERERGWMEQEGGDQQQQEQEFRDRRAKRDRAVAALTRGRMGGGPSGSIVQISDSSAPASGTSGGTSGGTSAAGVDGADDGLGTVFVEPIGDQPFVLDCRTSDTVAMLKAAIEAQTGLPVSKQILMLSRGGVTARMEDAHTLRECGAGFGARLKLFID